MRAGSGLPWLGLAAGIVILVGTALSVVRFLVVPRPPREPLSRAVLTGVRGVFRLGARRLSRYESKDRLLTLTEPVGLLVLLVTWVGLALVGWALVLWRVGTGTIGAAFRQAGSSMFTLGFAVSHHPSGVAVDFLAAASGLVIVALELAYLPVLYGAFNRREVLVAMLDSRAGVPAWGPELLARHQLVGIMDDLPTFYGSWEAWAADVAESHTNYPALLWFRSPRPLYSWVIGLLAVLDSAALYLALSPRRAPSQARLCLRMGFTALREVARALRIPFNPDPDPEDPLELEFEEFAGAVAHLQRAGFPMERTAAEAWADFRGWRVNYESLVYALADLLMAPPAPWSGPRHHLPVAEIPPQRPVDRRPGRSGPSGPGAVVAPPPASPGRGRPPLRG